MLGTYDVASAWSVKNLLKAALSLFESLHFVDAQQESESPEKSQRGRAVEAASQWRSSDPYLCPSANQIYSYCIKL